MTDTQPAALAADQSGDATDMVGRWYMLNKMGMATLCTDKEGAEQEAADAQMAWPHMGPHRAVQLVDAQAASAELCRLRAAHQHANGNVALLADILSRRPAMNAGLVEAYAAWTAEVYNLMGAMAAAPANDADRTVPAAGAVAESEDAINVQEPNHD